MFVKSTTTMSVLRATQAVTAAFEYSDVGTYREFVETNYGGVERSCLSKARFDSRREARPWCAMAGGRTASSTPTTAATATHGTWVTTARRRTAALVHDLGVTARS